MPQYGANDLVITAGLTFTHAFTAPGEGSWLGRVNRLQMRSVYGDNLLIELTAFLEVDGSDPTKLNLEIDAEMTSKLVREGVYDIYSSDEFNPADAFRTPKGRIIVRPGVTRL